jgi:hypothetical protein
MKEKLLHKTERGQAIVLIAMSIIGLIAMVGLMIDGGTLFIEYARLKRGIDAASVAAALQFKQGSTEAELAVSAREMLLLNQSDIIVDPADPKTLKIEVCPRDADGNPSDAAMAAADPALCTSVPRKMVRVTASRTVHFGFMSVLGFRETTITATSIGEAASVDLVLVIDTSASMSYETTGGANVPDPGDDPAICNQPVGTLTTCQPLRDVIGVADAFVNNLYFPYDRVAIVASTSQAPDGNRDPILVQHLSPNKTTVREALANLKVFEPPGPCNFTDPNPPPGPCRKFTGGGLYEGNDCAFCRTFPITVGPNSFPDMKSYPSSNIGGSMIWAGNEFGSDPAMIREDSLWLVIVIAGGPANASNAQGDPYDVGNPYRFGYCPDPTNITSPNCRDRELSSNPSDQTRHAVTDLAHYDSDDYAYDWADWVAGAASDSNPTDVDGIGAVVFTIGLGKLVRETSIGDPMDGEQLLKYMAEKAGDNISPGVVLNHGFYSYAPDASGLAVIFQKIADNIFTRISQ